MRGRYLLPVLAVCLPCYLRPDVVPLSGLSSFRALGACGVQGAVLLALGATRRRAFLLALHAGAAQPSGRADPGAPPLPSGPSTSDARRGSGKAE